MNLNFLCTPKTPGIVRWRYLNFKCPVYFNRKHKQIQFNKCFQEFGFIRGVKIVILEHFSDPIGKILFSIATPEEEKFAYSLIDWEKNGINKKPGLTSLSCRNFFETLLIPTLNQTKKIKSRDGIGESGFFIDAVPLKYGERTFFEIDFNNARKPSRKKESEVADE